MNTVTRTVATAAPLARSPQGLKALGLAGTMVLVVGLLLGFVNTCQESVLRGERLDQQFRAHGRSEPIQGQPPVTAHASASWNRS